MREVLGLGLGLGLGTAAAAGLGVGLGLGSGLRTGTGPGAGSWYQEGTSESKAAIDSSLAMSPWKSHPTPPQSTLQPQVQSNHKPTYTPTPSLPYNDPMV